LIRFGDLIASVPLTIPELSPQVCATDLHCPLPLSPSSNTLAVYFMHLAPVPCISFIFLRCTYRQYFKHVRALQYTIVARVFVCCEGLFSISLVLMNMMKLSGLTLESETLHLEIKIAFETLFANGVG
jgi:hypothetical protein